MRISDKRAAGGKPQPLRLGMRFRRKTNADERLQASLTDEAPSPRFTVYRALRHGLAFSLGQPIHLLRLTVLPVLGSLTSLFLFVAYHMAYMAQVPDQFGPVDWLRAGATLVLFLWAWTALWSGLFGHFFGKWHRNPDGPLTQRGGTLRLFTAFAVLWALPAGATALLIWGSSVFQYAQLASADFVLPLANYQPQPLGQDMALSWPVWDSSGVVGQIATVGLVATTSIFLVRLGFLIPDAVAAGRLNPFRVWRQSQGLFWPTIGLFVFSLPALLMLLGGPTTLGIFATYYLYPELLAEDVKITLVARDVWDLMPLWPTFVGGAVGISFCAAFWTAAFGTLYRSRMAT